MYKFWKSVSLETFIETLKKMQTFMEKKKEKFYGTSFAKSSILDTWQCPKYASFYER